MSAVPRISAQSLVDRVVGDPVMGFAEESSRVVSANQLERLIGRYLAPYGIGSYTLYVATDAQHRPSAAKIAGKSHIEWRGHYIANKLEHVDDLLKAGLTSNAPTTWSRFRRERGLSRRQERIYDEASEYGLKDGFYLPLHQADGSMLGLSMMAPEQLPTDQGTLAILHMLSLYYALAAERLGLIAAARGEAGPKLKPAELTARQIECLQWIAAGKSSWEISEILGLSEYTINEHLAAARKRLGVRTTTQAAIQAVLRGLVRP